MDLEVKMWCDGMVAWCDECGVLRMSRFGVMGHDGVNGASDPCQPINTTAVVGEK